MPLSIIMMVMILLAGIGIGTVVLEGSQRAVDIDRSVSAYYMADSGVERQLYEVRKVGTPLATIGAIGSTYPNGSSWKFNGSFASTTNKIIPSVATSSFAVVDLFDPDNVGPAGADQVTVTWNNGPDCGLQYANLEVGYAEWNLSGNIIPNKFTIEKKNDSTILAPGDQNQAIILDANRSYRLRLAPSICSVANVVVQPLSAGVPTVFPGDVTLSAEGTFGPASQKIAVTMPKLDVLSGLFNFVVFTECTLVKQDGVTPICPP